MKYQKLGCSYHVYNYKLAERKKERVVDKSQEEKALDSKRGAV